MLEVLRWLDRFDLDGKQITARRFRSLVENNQMPLRKVEQVFYSGRYGPRKKPNKLMICLEDDYKAQVQLTFETDADVRKAALNLSSCFVRGFHVNDHTNTLPRNAVIAAPPLIHHLDIRFCDFDKGEEDTLSATLNGSTFQRLSLVALAIPAWQIGKKRLESLRRRGCNEIEVVGTPNPSRVDGKYQKYDVTEDGILSYCFSLDDDLPLPDRRSLRTDANSASITPAFFKKVAEASKNSQLTCDVKLCLEDLRFDIGNLDVGVLPSRSQEFVPFLEADEHHVRYNIADHGNGVRLLMHFTSIDGVKWNAVVRHGKKDREEFFEPPEEEANEEEEEDNEQEEEANEEN